MRGKLLEGGRKNHGVEISLFRVEYTLGLYMLYALLL